MLAWLYPFGFSEAGPAYRLQLASLGAQLALDLWDQTSAQSHRIVESEGEEKRKRSSCTFLVVHCRVDAFCYTAKGRIDCISFAGIVFVKKAYGKSVPPVYCGLGSKHLRLTGSYCYTVVVD